MGSVKSRRGVKTYSSYCSAIILPIPIIPFFISHANSTSLCRTLATVPLTPGPQSCTQLLDAWACVRVHSQLHSTSLAILCDWRSSHSLSRSTLAIRPIPEPRSFGNDATDGRDDAGATRGAGPGRACQVHHRSYTVLRDAGRCPFDLIQLKL